MTRLVWAVFDDEGAYLRARTRAVAGERRIVGEWLPYASDALGEGPSQRGIRAATIVVGVCVAAALFGLESWSAVLAYRFDAGGRPAWSWPAFVPAVVEFGAFAGALGGVIAFFVRARLTRLHDAAFDVPEVERVSQGAFVLAIACDAGTDANTVTALVAEAGATHSRVAER